MVTEPLGATPQIPRFGGSIATSSGVTASPAHGSLLPFNQRLQLLHLFLHLLLQK